ncbi:MAG: hypothetical protein FWH18_07345 [Marinilabiliaceae bacterium]|nr:hypothetical protein [Marinilabiliaceae bacterium]
MNNLKNMLSRSDTVSEPELIKDSNNEIFISTKLAFELGEYVRDFQYHKAIQTGNIYLSFKDAVAEIISDHKKQHPEVKPRPEEVRKLEKKVGRKKK